MDSKIDPKEEQHEEDQKLITAGNPTSFSSSATYQRRPKLRLLRRTKLNVINEENVEDCGKMESDNDACTSAAGSRFSFHSTTKQHRKPATSRKRKLCAILEEDEEEAAEVDLGTKAKCRKEDTSVSLLSIKPELALEPVLISTTEKTTTSDRNEGVISYSDDCGESPKYQEKQNSSFEYWKKKEQSEGDKVFDFSRRHDPTIKMAKCLDDFSFFQKDHESSSNFTGSQGTSTKKPILQSNSTVNLPIGQEHLTVEPTEIPECSDDQINSHNITRLISH